LQAYRAVSDPVVELENAGHLEADELTVGPLFAASLSTAMELFSANGCLFSGFASLSTPLSYRE
jgi:hypothetical protein